MVKNDIPWAVGVVHFKGHAGVITDIPVLTHIIPNLFNGIRSELFGGHADGKSGAMGTIDRMRIAPVDGLAASAASFDVRKTINILIISFFQ